MNDQNYEVPEEYIKKGRALAWLAYFGLLLIIPAILQKNNPFTVYHVKQGVALLMVSIGSVFLCFVPIVGVYLCQIASIILLVINLIGIYNAITGKIKPLPLIGFIGESLRF